MTTTAEALRTEYLEAVDGLIRRYPIQGGNRKHCEEWARSARLGRTTRRIRSKGGLTDIPRGTVVLFTPDPGPDGLDRGLVSVWAPRPDGDCLRTLAGEGGVRAECETCGGSRAVYGHPTALVTMACPSC
jgi:hypothetical protein